jgi:hypothetical protein
MPLGRRDLVAPTLAVAQAEDEVITVGPWTIAASSKADKFDSCTMSRSTDDLNFSFVRAVFTLCRERSH